MDNIDDAKFITDTVKQLNMCIKDWYKDTFPGKKNRDTRSEFTSCCNEDEIRIILQCANIYLENNSTANKEEVLLAMISYYYTAQVLEHYLGYEQAMDFDCMKKFNNSSKSIYQIRDEITTSNASWASQIRSMMLGLNLGSGLNVGGRRNKKQKTRKYRYSKKYKLKKRKNKTLKKRN